MCSVRNGTQRLARAVIFLRQPSSFSAQILIMAGFCSNSDHDRKAEPASLDGLADWANRLPQRHLDNGIRRANRDGSRLKLSRDNGDVACRPTPGNRATMPQPAVPRPPSRYHGRRPTCLRPSLDNIKSPLKPRLVASDSLPNNLAQVIARRNSVLHLIVRNEDKPHGRSPAAVNYNHCNTAPKSSEIIHCGQYGK